MVTSTIAEIGFKPKDIMGLFEFAKFFAAKDELGGLGEKEIYDTIRFWTMSVKDYLDEYFESEVVKAHLAGSAIISGIALILFYTNFGSVIKSEFIVQFRINSNDPNITSQYNKLISDFTKSHTLLSSESSGDGKTIKVSFDVVMKEEMKQNELISKISKIDGVSEVVIIAAKSDVDY